MGSVDTFSCFAAMIQADLLDEILESKGQENKVVQRSGRYLFTIQFDARAEVSGLTG